MRAKLLLGLLAMLWIGMILAVGMESVVKFDTPSLARVIAFDEGRYVFSFFNKVEFVLLAVMFCLVLIADVDWLERCLFVIVAAILCVQVFYLLPALSHHVDLLLAGLRAPKSYAHAIFGWAELVKVVLLSIIPIRLLIYLAK